MVVRRGRGAEDFDTRERLWPNPNMPMDCSCESEPSQVSCRTDFSCASCRWPEPEVFRPLDRSGRCLALPVGRLTGIVVVRFHNLAD